MKDSEFFEKLNLDNLQKNIPDMKTGISSDGSLDTPFFEYDAFMKWYEDYCIEVSDVYNCNVNFAPEGMNDGTFGCVLSPTEENITSGKYYSDININAKYFDPENTNISLVKSFTDSNNNQVQGISAKDAYKAVFAVTHEGRHLEQGEHLVKGTNDESLDAVMPAMLASSYNPIHYDETYFRDPGEVDAQNAGLSRGFNIMCSCFPEYADMWLDNTKESMREDGRYAKYMNSASRSVETASDINQVMRDAFADSCIEYDGSYETLLESSDDPFFVFDMDDIYERNHTKIPYSAEEFSDSADFSIEDFNKSKEAHEKAQEEQTRLDDEAFMNKLDENPSYITFHNDYMQEKLGEVNPDLLKTERFTRLTDNINQIREPLNKAAGYWKKICDGMGGNSKDYAPLRDEAREAFSELIPDYSIVEYETSQEAPEKDINKKLQEITGIDFDKHEQEMQAASLESKQSDSEFFAGRGPKLPGGIPID